MATWLDKLSTAAEKLVTKVESATATAVRTYQEKGFDGIVDKTGDLFNKTGEQLEKTGSNAFDKTEEYLKNLGKSNSDKMKDVERNLGKGTLNSKIAKGIAATVNTTQILAEDLTKVTKKAYKNVSDELNEITKEEVVPSADEAVFAEKIKNLGQIPITLTLLEVLNAKPSDSIGTWKDPSGLTFKIINESWFEPESQTSGKNSINLLSFRFAKITGMDYNNPNHKKELEKEAVHILETFCADYGKEKTVKPVVKESTAVKAPAKKVAKAIDVSPAKKTVKKSATPAKKVATKVAKEVKAPVKTIAKKAVKKVADIAPVAKKRAKP